MPHDRTGQPIEVGGEVTVSFRVQAVQSGDEYCNVTLESVERMYPGEHKTVLNVNARQVDVADLPRARIAEAQNDLLLAFQYMPYDLNEKAYITGHQLRCVEAAIGKIERAMRYMGIKPLHHFKEPNYVAPSGSER
jgi:hypothetical protein